MEGEGALEQTNRRSVTPFYCTHAFPSAERVKSDLLAFAASAGARILNSKKLKLAANSVRRTNLRERSAGVGKQSRLLQAITTKDASQRR